MKQFKISEDKAQAVINYLVTCAYGQVYQLVEMMMGLEEIKEEKKPKDKVDKKNSDEQPQ